MQAMSTNEQLCLQFSLDDIKEATNNFDVELIIGKGGFGFVYLGMINIGEKFVAIKRLSSESTQGEAEFLREIETLSKLQHDNLVRLEGYCSESPEKILVYEYMPNGTLVDHLYKSRGPATNIGDNQPYHLTWEERLNISIGAAQGLDFLHRGVVPGVIHRDIKDSNILLDSKLRAKIADFGLAKLVKRTGDPMITSVSTTIVKGTFGYLDPEYFYTQRLTTKTDVYAFGVVLLVVLSGRPAVDNTAVEDQRSLAEWATKCIAKKRLDLIIDPNLVAKISSKSLQQFVKIAQKCLYKQSDQRPTMEEVVAGLQLALKKQPTTSTTSSKIPSGRSSSTQMAVATLIKTMKEKHPDMAHVVEVFNIVRTLLEGKEKKQVQLSEGEIRLLCVKARRIFMSEPSLLEVQAPIKICGDMHGQYQDLLRIFKSGGFPPSASYLFLGNYVDHGKQSLETICLLLAFKILYPDKVFLLRGNHEVSNINRTYGFYDECDRRYNVRLWKIFNNCFNFLPVAALVDDKIFCLHSGLSPDLKHIKQIEELPKPTDVPAHGLLSDLLWSDPDPNIKGWSPRGFSYTFGPDKVAEFLQNNDINLICRGNQVAEDGYEFFAERGLVTIFSAPKFIAERGIATISPDPNWHREFNNAGAVLTVDESMMCSFEILWPIFDTEAEEAVGSWVSGTTSTPVFGE